MLPIKTIIWFPEAQNLIVRVSFSIIGNKGGSTSSSGIVLMIFFQLRLPDRVSEDVQEDPTGLRSNWDRGHLNGASQKVSNFEKLNNIVSNLRLLTKMSISNVLNCELFKLKDFGCHSWKSCEKKMQKAIVCLFKQSRFKKYD